MDKELYTGYCPNCDYKIDYNKNDKTVQCPVCDMNFSVNSLANLSIYVELTFTYNLCFILGISSLKNVIYLFDICVLGVVDYILRLYQLFFS